MTVKELIRQLMKLDPNMEVTSKASHPGFVGAPRTVFEVSTDVMAENKPYAVWTGGSGWSNTKSGDMRKVVVLQ